MKLGSVGVAFGKARIRTVSRWMAVLGIAAAAAIAFAVVFSLRFSRSFVSPIKEVMDFSRKVATGRPVGTSQIRTVPSTDADASLLSGLKATVNTELEWPRSTFASTSPL